MRRPIRRNPAWQDRPTVLDDPADVLWAIEMHVLGKVGRELATPATRYKFAILYGNEDFPSRIEFWKSSNPHHDSKPNAVWINPDN